MSSGDDDPAPEDPFERLRELIAALSELDAGHRSGDGDDADDGDNSDDGPFRVDYDVDVSFGLDDFDGTGRSPPRGSKRTRHPGLAGGRGSGGADDGDAPRTVDPDDLADATDESYHVDVREDGDELEVTADLPGVESEPTVDVTDGDVVIRLDGETVRRVPTDWAAGTVTRATFNNGVLVVGIRREVDGDGDADTPGNGTGDENGGGTDE